MPLTQEQKSKVVQYRNDGIGYKRIARLLGVKRDQVKRVCVAFDLTGKLGKTTEPKEYECVICGNKYVGKDGISKLYCSLDCKDNAKKLRHERTIKRKTFTCRTCGKEFVRNGSQVYCSNECRYETRLCCVCGKEFRVNVESKVKTCGLSCAKYLKRKSHEDYYKEFSAIHKGRIVPITVYQGNDNDITAYCIECGKTTTRTADKFLFRKLGCRHCGRKLSTGEEAVRVWLDDNKISYVSQYTPNDSLLIFRLRYDFAITNDDGSIKCLIEYNGRQHYEPVESFGGDAEFSKQIQSDSAKEWYAKERHIPLIKISYKDKNKLADILNEQLRVCRRSF